MPGPVWGYNWKIHLGYVLFTPIRAAIWIERKIVDYLLGNP